MKSISGVWLHGIPGAGKTVLAAHLTQETAKLEERAQVASVYYYCSHTRNHDEAAPFLRWVVAQLCRKAGDVPTRVFEIFKNDRQPSLEQFLTCLEEVLSFFETVFITLDAVTRVSHEKFCSMF